MSSGSGQSGGSPGYDGMMGWVRSGVAASIFLTISWYVFFQVPRERQAAMDHGSEIVKAIVDQHKAEIDNSNKELVSLFNRMLDQQTTGVRIAKDNAEVNKKILATAQGNTMEIVPEPKANGEKP